MVDPSANTASILPLKLQNVSVRKRGKTIIDGISLELQETGVTLVMGPNGSGKTTLLKAMHGLERIRSGAVSWAGLQTMVQSRQSFVFQTPVMMRRSVQDNIAYPLKVRGQSNADARAQAKDCANTIDLGNKLNLDAAFLSGGERQKLALARALITKPQVLFLDEPTTNLDGKSTREIEAILRDASTSGTRIIMTTHDIGQAKRLATDIVFLNNGQLCEQSPAETFFESPSSVAAKAYLQGDIVE